MTWEKLLAAKRDDQKTGVSGASRSAFEQDYDRIIFSHPFRRLQDKTQVHPLPEYDFVHTRLTHSLEVSSVARSLGRNAGEQIIQRHRLTDQYSQFDFGAITAAAALAHDIGNPPFGHAGEEALGDFFTHSNYGQSIREKVTPAEWTDLTKFEGNAQGFRLLTLPETGLKLTYGTLGAFTKYPCSSNIEGRDKKKKSQKKFGFFQSERNTFQTIAEDLALLNVKSEAWTRHPLAFLVEAADDICYSIIDLEDGCRLGLVSFSDTVELLAGILHDDFDNEKLNRIHGQTQKLAVLRAVAIRKLVDQCSEVFLDNEVRILSGEFDEALTDKCASRALLQRISEFSIKNIYRSRSVLEIESSGHVVLPGLLEEFCVAAEYLKESGTSKNTPRKYSNLSLLMPEETQWAVRNSASTYEVMRAVLDFVSALTDKHALSLYRKIKGISL
jgi:dGTPase